MSRRNYIFFLDLGFIATLIVLALSKTEIPVVIPFFASIETVKAVCILDLLIETLMEILIFQFVFL